MFKKENQVWLYLVGILILFGILIIFARDIVLPAVNRRNLPDTIANIAKPTQILQQERDYKARLVTNLGNIEVDLYEKNAPVNVNNFTYLSQNNYYNNTKFHRVVKDFLIQGGDRNTINGDTTLFGRGKTNYFINDEINWDSLELSDERIERLKSGGYSSTPNLDSIKFKQYSLAMANSGPNTNSSQFFLVTAPMSDNRIEELNGFFTNIGEVTSGFEIIQTINNSVDNNNTLPSELITIQEIEIFF